MSQHAWLKINVISLPTRWEKNKLEQMYQWLIEERNNLLIECFTVARLDFQI